MDLPGLYFDKEKNKYFKIEPGTAHSTEIVKRRRLNDARADEERTQKLIRQSHITPSPTLQDPLLGGLVRRELGGRCALDEALVAGFEGPETIFEDDDDSRSELPMPAFDWDPVTRGLFIPRSGHRMLTGCPETSLSGCRQIYRSPDCRSLVYEPKKIKTISVNESARLVATTRSDTFGPFGIVLVFLQNTVALPNDPDRPVADGSHIHISPPHASDRPNMTVWTSTPAPSASDLSFVIGMDNNIMAIGKERTNTKWITHCSRQTVEVLALEFQESSKDVLLTGDRKGRVGILDLRDPSPSFGHDAVQHGTSVIHIKSLDAHRILVAGPGEAGSSMAQYDLRWRKPGIALATRKTARSHTRPILEYAEHGNTYPRFGLAVDVDAGLVAAAQEDRTVRLFSLHGGRRLDFVGEREPRDHAVECLRFVPDRDGGARSLYVAGLDTISRYAW